MTRTEKMFGEHLLFDLWLGGLGNFLNPIDHTPGMIFLKCTDKELEKVCATWLKEHLDTHHNPSLELNGLAHDLMYSTHRLQQIAKTKNFDVKLHNVNHLREQLKSILGVLIMDIKMAGE